MDADKELVWDILTTDRHADFKEYRRQHRSTWLTKEREVLIIADMETSHIISCVNMLEACDQEYTQAYEGLTREINDRINQRLKWRYED